MEHGWMREGLRDTSTNWTASEWKEIDALRENPSEQEVGEFALRAAPPKRWVTGANGERWEHKGQRPIEPTLQDLARILEIEARDLRRWRNQALRQDTRKEQEDE